MIKIARLIDNVELTQQFNVYCSSRGRLFGRQWTSCWSVCTECARRIARGSVLTRVLNILDRLVVLIDWCQVCSMSSSYLTIYQKK